MPISGHSSVKSHAEQLSVAWLSTALKASIWVELVCRGITPLWSDTLSFLAHRG